MANSERDPIAAGHETSDVNVRAVIRFGAGLAIFVSVTMVLIAMLLRMFDADRRAEEPPLPALVAKERTELPQDLMRIPPPRLQIADYEDMRNLREENKAMLDSYGWVDRDAGVVRIPIERAMELIAAKGLARD